MKFTQYRPVATSKQRSGGRQGTASTTQIGVSKPSKQGTPKKNPGGTVYSQNVKRPIVEGTTSAWVRTLFDPAHARDFGCVGLPDENQTPTAVLSHRYDLVLNKSNVLNPSNYYTLTALRDLGGGVLSTSSITTEQPGSASTYNKIYLCNHPDIGVVVICDGVFDYNGTVYTRTIGLLSEPNAFIQSASVTGRTNCRALSSSITVSNVTAWSNIGGYFTGGNFPWTMEVESANDVLYFPKSIDSYATYTGEAAAGGYAIGRPRSIDQIKLFKGTEQFKISVDLSTSTANPVVIDNSWTALYSLSPAWDWSYVCYCPCDTNSWTLRMTWFGNYEVTRGYSQGGQDGAVFDKAALELAISLCDSIQFVYPAEYNDLAILLPVIRKMAKFAIRKITSGMGLTPTMSDDVARLVDALLSRRDARKQLVRTKM